MIGVGGYDFNSNVNRITQLFKNGSGITQAQQQLPAANSSNATMVQAAWKIQMNVGDYCETYAYQSSGGALNTYAAGCSMQCIWLHA